LAYILFPLIRKLEKKGIHRNIATIFISFIFILIISAITYFVVPKLYQDAKAFIKELPTYTLALLEKTEVIFQKFDIALDLSKDNIEEIISTNITTISGSILQKMTTGLEGFFSSLINIMLFILNIFLVPLFFYYVVNDYEKIIKNIKELVPDVFEPKVQKYISLTDKVLSDFVRGQLLVAICLGTIYAIGLTIIGLKFGLLIGFISGVLCLIPYVGAILGFFIAAIVGFTTNLDINHIFQITCLYGVTQALEGNVITPKLVGNKVGLSAFVSVLALIIGGNLFGFIGMIFAIPIAAIVKSIFKELKSEYLDFEL
jgi:predicted PurR-regulated permease PerM